MFDALQWIANWLSDIPGGITAFFDGAMAKVVEWLVLTKIKALVWAIDFSWGVAKNVLQALGADTIIADAFAVLPQDYASALRFFGVDQVVNMVMTASVTK